ncbi:hypothetical protein ACFQL4_17255 [Halosimplex aquaticum]
MPRAARSLLVGETLIHVSVALVSVFVIVVVTSVLGLRTTLFGVRLNPSATFGALVLTELAVATAASAAARRVDAPRDGAARLVGVAALAAAFPLLFVGLPPVAGVVAALFAVAGVRGAGAAIRDERVEAVVSDAAVDPQQYRTARALVVAPSPLVGGVLYTLDPTVAFGAATTVGAVGVWELWRYARRTDGAL